jgi:hypothetical protein
MEAAPRRVRRRGAATGGAVPQSQARWLRTRFYLNAHRHELTLAAQDLYPAAWRVADTSLLAGPGWLPGRPVPMDRVVLTWRPGLHRKGTDGTGPESAAIRPTATDRGAPFASYSAALGALARPGLYENRVCYRLLDAAASPAAAHLAFGEGSYFEMINICEAVAHEYAAAALNRRPGLCGSPVHGEVPVRISLTGNPSAASLLPLRTKVGNPADPRRRPVMTAVTTLTLRADRDTGEASMILLWRDPSQVASGGGLYQVAPAGMFQPSHNAPWNLANDFSLWRAIVRELAEELLGCGEDYGSAGRPVDYDAWPLYAALSRARRAGQARLFWLGMGVDPLSLAADQLTVLVLDAPVFDELFGTLAPANPEGHLLTRDPDASPGAPPGVSFTEGNVTLFSSGRPTVPASAALLRLAWEHRAFLLKH